MPVLINNLKEKGFFKIRVEISEAFDMDDPDEQENAEAWAGAWIDIRELSASEAAEFHNSPEEFMERLDQVIVDHNFYQDKEGKKKASKEQVADIIKASSTVYNHVMTKWAEHLPLAKRSARSSEK